MDFKIDKNEFLRGLYLAHGIADRKSTLPILANVLLRTDGKDKVMCAATDLNVTALSSLTARVEKEGGLTVAARQLYEIVKGLPGDEVRVRRTEQNWAEIRAGKVEFKVVGMADRDYPKLPSVKEAETFKVDSATLRDMIAKTIFSVSQDETRQHLSGVLFESDGTTARMVSTDGHRLSKVGRSLPGGPKLANGILIPRKGILEVRRAIEIARGSLRDRRSSGELRPQGRRRQPVRQADRRAVPSLRSGDSEGQRARVRGVAGRAAGRASTGGHHVVGQDPGRAPRGSRRASCAWRATIPIWAPRARKSMFRTRACLFRSGSTPGTSSSFWARSRRRMSASSCRESSTPAWCARRTAATTSASSCRCGSDGAIRELLTFRAALRIKEIACGRLAEPHAPGSHARSERSAERSIRRQRPGQNERS